MIDLTGMFGRMMPSGFGRITKQVGGPKRSRKPSLDTLIHLPGATEWAFFCINLHTAIATNAAINNVSPSIPAQFKVPNGFEGVVTSINIGPNVIPTSGGNGTWFPGLVVNMTPVPGWYPLPTLEATDGMGNWWQPKCEIYLEESSLVQLVKVGDTLGAGNPADIGGSVRGYIWPIRARMTWEKTVGRLPLSSSEG